MIETIFLNVPVERISKYALLTSSYYFIGERKRDLMNQYEGGRVGILTSFFSCYFSVLLLETNKTDDFEKDSEIKIVFFFLYLIIFLIRYVTMINLL